MASAQQARLEMICRKPHLAPGEHFLDIGCGWGGLVCHAAQHHWAERLSAQREAAAAEVGAAKTLVWLLYLAGVSRAFERGTIGICQTLASRRARSASGLPPTRADLYR